MIIFEKFKDKIKSKYTPKRTKSHDLKKILGGGGIPPNPPNKAHDFAMCSMSLRDMQISKSEINFPPPSQILATPLLTIHYSVNLGINFIPVSHELFTAQFNAH